MRLVLLVVVGVFGALALGAVVQAQTNAGGTGPSAPVDQNCAVSTARIGTTDVTEFFGIRGGATSFAQSFGPASSEGSTTMPSQTVAERCLRLEVENPAPGDLIPVGGYVMGGFAFDPTVGAGQGSGISTVQVFLDDPNQGGAVVANASVGLGTSGMGLGLSSARGAAFGDQFANSGFHMTVQIPSSAAGSSHALFVVALTNSGRVGTVALPVVVGNLTPAVPTRTP
jgi:hypothetical protein